jgi:glycosyltransferase involved in cell wall biosynthesis
LLMRYLRILQSERPCLYLGYTIKPNVYGSLAAHILHIPVINSITGLGTVFIANNVLTQIVKNLYKVALSRSRRVFFQNTEDQDMFVRSGLVRESATDRIPGSGIDLERYVLNSSPVRMNGSLRFLLIGRMLKFKGIVEFVKAARIVRQEFPEAKFQLLGGVDSANANSIPLQTIHEWEREGLIDYLGEADDVRPYIAASGCVVLPSYREGVPRSLLEAAAMAKPIIATDVAGCRDVVDDGVNGFLCQVKNPIDLAVKMKKMFSLIPEEREKMGKFGRLKIESQFDEKFVIQKYLDTIATCEGMSRNSPNTTLAGRH